MSEDQERNSSGQFVAASEMAFGEAGIEQAMGYVPNEQPSVSDEDPLAEEAIALDALFPADADHPVVDGTTGAELSTVPAVLVDRETGEKLPEHITLRPEEAGNQIATYEANLATYVDGMADAELQGLIDQRRGSA